MIRRFSRVAMKEFLRQPFDRSPEDEHKQRDDDRYSKQRPITKPADNAEHRANPDRSCRRESRDVPHRIAQNHSSSEKPDASQNTLDDTCDRIRIGNSSVRRSERKKGGDRGAETDQRVRPQPGRFPVQLAIQPENRAEDQGGAETQHGLFVSSEHDQPLSRNSTARRKSFWVRFSIALRFDLPHARPNYDETDPAARLSRQSDFLCAIRHSAFSTVEMAATAPALLRAAKTGAQPSIFGAGILAPAASAYPDSARPLFLGAGKRNWIVELDKITAGYCGDRGVSADGLGLLLVALGDAPHPVLLAVP